MALWLGIMRRVKRGAINFIKNIALFNKLFPEIPSSSNVMVPNNEYQQIC